MPGGYSGKMNPSALAGAASQPYLMGLANASKPATQQAGATLNYLLQQQGRTDPRMMNTMRSQIAGDTAQRARQSQGAVARAGWGNSGLGMALQNAIKGGGAQRENDLMARDAQMAEDRKRQDLELFQQIIGNPAMDNQAMSFQDYQQRRQLAEQRRNATMQMVGTLMGGMSGAGAR